MSNHIKSFIVSIIIASPFVCVGQSNLLNAKVPTDIGKLSEVQIASNDNTPVPYGFVDDRDVMWSKIIWETIDLDERINFPLYYPTVNNGLLSSTRKSLFRILMGGGQVGSRCLRPLRSEVTSPSREAATIVHNTQLNLQWYIIVVVR